MEVSATLLVFSLASSRYAIWLAFPVRWVDPLLDFSTMAADRSASSSANMSLVLWHPLVQLRAVEKTIGLPVEIMLRIISYVPFDRQTIRALERASPILRDIINENKAHLCSLIAKHQFLELCHIYHWAEPALFPELSVLSYNQAVFNRFLNLALIMRVSRRNLPFESIADDRPAYLMGLYIIEQIAEIPDLLEKRRFIASMRPSALILVRYAATLINEVCKPIEQQLAVQLPMVDLNHWDESELGGITLEAMLHFGIEFVTPLPQRLLHPLRHYLVSHDRSAFGNGTFASHAFKLYISLEMCLHYERTLGAYLLYEYDRQVMLPRNRIKYESSYLVTTTSLAKQYGLDNGEKERQLRAQVSELDGRNGPIRGNPLSLL